MSSLKKLSLALASLAISGALAGPASALNSTELAQIRAYVEAGDDVALRSYLLENLSSLDDSPLSQALLAFVSAPPERTVLANLGFQNPVPSDLVDIVERTKTDPSLY